MNRDEIEAIVLRELSAFDYRTTPSPISADTTLRDELGLNSLDAVDLALKLEDELEIEIPDDELTSFQTVGQIVDTVVERLSAAGAADR